MIWKKENFLFKETIGSGSNSKVILGVDRQTKKQVAIKMISLKKIIDQQADHFLRREIEIHSHLEFFNQFQAHRKISRIFH